MKTSQVFSAMVGAALLSGAAFAQADGPQGPGPRGDGPGVRPEGSGRGRMQQRGPGQEGGGCPMMQRGGSEGGCPAMQQRGPEGMGGPQMGRGCPMLGSGPQEIPGPMRLKEVGATDQQMEALKKLGDEQQLKRIDLQAAVEKAEVTLRQLMESDAVEEKGALKAVDALSQARAELMKQEISSKLKAKEILGAELIKKIREMGPPQGMERQGRGPRPEGRCPQRKERDTPPAGERPPPPEQK